MAERKAFPLRLDPVILAALSKWAGDDLRSMNGQIEYLLREALRTAGRLKERGGVRKDGGGSGRDGGG